MATTLLTPTLQRTLTAQTTRTTTVPTEEVTNYKKWAGAAALVPSSWPVPLVVPQSYYDAYQDAKSRALILSASAVAVPANLQSGLSAYWKQYDRKGWAAWDNAIIDAPVRLMAPVMHEPRHLMLQAPTGLLSYLQARVAAYGLTDALNVPPTDAEKAALFALSTPTTAQAASSNSGSRVMTIGPSPYAPPAAPAPIVDLPVSSGVPWGTVALLGGGALAGWWLLRRLGKKAKR